MNPLAPYDSRQQGWTRRDAAHLLWRTQCGASEAEVARALIEGLEKTLDRLLTPPAEDASFAETAALLRQTAGDADDIDQLKTWWLYRMTEGPSPLTEKMCLFWHNHFATSNVKVRSAKHMAAQNDLFRTHALGDFKALLAGIARDVAMLIWLDGNANRHRSPNENFARELMELFTLGVGHYSEADIREAARAFTGWHVRKDEFWFNRLQHDTGGKKVFGSSGNFDGDEVLRLCLAHDACPRFLALKLLREFVVPSPGESEIAALAASIRAHDFQMRPVLRELLGSQLFFSAAARHSLIKSPVQFVLGACRTLEVRPNLKAIARIIANLGQDLFLPPTVKGWEGGRLWITSATLFQRANFAASLTGSDTYGKLTAPVTTVTRQAELLLACDADTAPAATWYDKASGSIESRARGALHLILTMPEFQLT
ncbi:MAG TPA: DUF1800 domain-containing protein [Verrucomicrobiales bacterium]|nr:DUF1800 domain-containing protein [Verrucomicrobiales bacterium]